MQIFKFLLSLGLLSILCCCQPKMEKPSVVEKTEENIEIPKQSQLDKPSECTITNETEKLKKELFPFEFKDFNTFNLKRYFSKKSTVDSSRHNEEGYSYIKYKFKEGSAFISFFVKPKEEGDSWFYLDESTIDNNLIEFKNGIKIGMQKGDVSKILGVTLTACDTLHFEEGDLFTYYDFIFKDDKLKKINIIPSE